MSVNNTAAAGSAPTYTNIENQYAIPELDINAQRAAWKALNAQATAPAAASDLPNKVTPPVKLSEEQEKIESLLKETVTAFAKQAFEWLEELDKKKFNGWDWSQTIPVRMQTISKSLQEIFKQLHERHKIFKCPEHPCICLWTQRNIKHLQKSIVSFQKNHAEYQTKLGTMDQTDKGVYENGFKFSYQLMLKKIHCFATNKVPEEFTRQPFVDTALLQKFQITNFDSLSIPQTFTSFPSIPALKQHLLTHSFEYLSVISSCVHQIPKEEVLPVLVQAGCDLSEPSLIFSFPDSIDFLREHGLDVNDQGYYTSLASQYESLAKRSIGLSSRSHLSIALDHGFDLSICQKPLFPPPQNNRERDSRVMLIAFGLYEEENSSVFSQTLAFDLRKRALKQHESIDWNQIREFMLTQTNILSDISELIKSYYCVSNQLIAAEIWRRVFEPERKAILDF